MVYRKIQSLLFDGVVKGAVPALGPSLSLFFPALWVDDMEHSILQLVASMPSQAHCRSRR